MRFDDIFPLSAGMYEKSRAGATLSEPPGWVTARAELFRPNHDHEQADNINGSAIVPHPLRTVHVNGERAKSGDCGADALRCGDAGAVLGKAAVEVRGVTLFD